MTCRRILHQIDQARSEKALKIGRCQHWKDLERFAIDTGERKNLHFASPTDARSLAAGAHLGLILSTLASSKNPKSPEQITASARSLLASSSNAAKSPRTSETQRMRRAMDGVAVVELLVVMVDEAAPPEVIVEVIGEVEVAMIEK